jgi:superfamily I DNA/RNA helicase
LNEVHGWLKSLGIIYERHGQRSLPENMIEAVYTWEQLRKGLEVETPAVVNVYRYLDADFVARGHKRLPKALPDELHTIHTLKEKHGLLTDVIWHEALTKISEDKREYIIAALRRGRKLKGHMPVKLSTIHGAKGGEADHVMLLTDLSSRFAAEYAVNSDSIHRMFYVGVTRAKKSLHIILPKNTNRGFQL